MAAWLPLLTAAVLLLAVPVAGALLSGHALSERLALPLRQPPWDPPPIDPLLAWGIALAAAAAALAILWLAWPRRPRPPAPAAAVPAALPRYAWFAALAALAAVIALDGGALNAAVGLIVLSATLLANADTERRTGHSLLRQRPGYFLALFPASLAAGWLGLYWINLFTGLWHYPQASETLPFVLGKSLDYATLLPALLSLRHWLASFPPLLHWTANGRAWAPAAGAAAPAEGWLALALGVTALFAAALWPEWLYPLAALAPLVAASGLQQLRRQPTPLAPLARGDWSRLLLAAAAALLLLLLGQALNALLWPAWLYQLPMLQPRPAAGLPLSTWLALLPIAAFALWIADQLAKPFRQRPQRPPFRARFPLGIPVVRDGRGDS